MSGPAAARPETWVIEAMEWVREGRSEDALELVESFTEGEEDLQVAGYRELIRAHVLDHYRAELSDAALVRRKMNPEEIMRFNLPSAAGFLVTILDGETAVGDVIALSGLDPFEARRNLHRLLRAGIAEAVS